jgi:hypothetical protein
VASVQRGDVAAEGVAPQQEGLQAGRVEAGDGARELVVGEGEDAEGGEAGPGGGDSAWLVLLLCLWGLGLVLVWWSWLGWCWGGGGGGFPFVALLCRRHQTHNNPPHRQTHAPSKPLKESLITSSRGQLQPASGGSGPVRRLLLRSSTRSSGRHRKSQPGRGPWRRQRARLSSLS